MVEVRGVEPLSKSDPMQTVTSIPPRLEQSPKDEQADKNPFGCASETCFQISMRRRIRKGEAMQSYFKKGFLQVSLPSRFIYFTTRQFGVCRREARSSRECVIFVSSIWRRCFRRTPSAWVMQSDNPCRNPITPPWFILLLYTIPTACVEKLKIFIWKEARLSAAKTHWESHIRQELQIRKFLRQLRR